MNLLLLLCAQALHSQLVTSNNSTEVNPINNEVESVNNVNATAISAVGSFIHITDIHIDENYLKGSDPEALCHRMGSSSNPDVGKFGAQGTKCDTPIDLVNEVYSHLKSNHQSINFVIDTGDVVRHDRDTAKPRTKKNVLDDHQRVVKYYQQTFDLNKIKVIPTIGNNDEIEHNQSEENSPLFKELEKIWKPYGLNLDKDFLKGGYFKAEVIPGKLTVISLNTLLWYKDNDLAKDCDKGSSFGKVQMEWLENQLNSLRNKGQKAYIIGHIGPRSKKGKKQYLKDCNEDFTDLVGSYNDVILAQFYGHSNLDSLTVISKKDSLIDEFKMTFINEEYMIDDGGGSPVGVITSGPSIIPLFNPSLRLYTYAPQAQKSLSAGTLLDYTQYYADIKEANKNGKLTWKTEYNTKKDYKLENLSLDSWKEFLKRLGKNKDGVFDKYKYFMTVSTGKDANGDD
ncbi:hypothetical protein CONCODRAFT_2670 [Conidiobolus coronatus NRRL 28638]|uniref:Calcineurin-like phosphoesterase domain-containing protein n=1 Tax=Conidiobolus coronatus (strain ATCC 28846 / CBS 209.66 / NRRL 28638) TaxID=796925 RepID=A0A137PH86_CONC2|nr:hypothetical protein CONCODRAFT_2670 [Conidiobolus coronatus NRRL 28638]|eukprot:KXN74291.1 hypothetical protein CONCODRAFT_2670 [Conidiobolus coronatus NRRL 28638]